MKNSFPQFFSGSRICIICEGDEEYEYLEKLKSLQLWSNKYKFVLENANGNGNIPARYQDKYQNGSYDMVLVFCDTDKKPYEEMKRRMKNLPVDDKIKGSSNFGRFLERFSSDDDKWIREINDILEGNDIEF